MKRLSIAALALSLALALAPAATAEDFQIVSGAPAADGAYPWMAAFLFSGGQGCGGSVIAANWVLTAAHCVADDRGQLATDPATVTFRVGTNNYTDNNGQTLQAAEIIVHPAYDATITSNDIALVRTVEAATVTPVTIAGPTNLALNDPPTVSRVIGYGTIRTNGDASEQLLQVDVDVVSDADCRNAGYGQLVDETMVCAGNPTMDSANPGRDSCQGDSGGPLFVENNGNPIQFGVVSFGGECGVNQPGVYSQVSTYFDWINGIVGGTLNQGDPDPGPAGMIPTGAEADPVRIQGTDGNSAVDNAIAMSQLVFQQDAAFGVLAASANFPDALGGSALASYFGPLLYANADGTLDPKTLTEFQRTVPNGGTIYILGGEAAVPAAAATELTDAGFAVNRLGGAGRQQTARLVAEEVRNVVNEGAPPFNSVIIAFEGNWPDAVAVGQISAWFGIPILLTPTAELGASAEEYLTTHQPDLVMTLGGTAVISQNVLDQVQTLIGAGRLQPLFGDTRLVTSADITFFNRGELFPQSGEVFEFTGDPITSPELIVAVNLRRDDAFTHVLAASMIVGNFGGMFAPLDGEGDVLDQAVIDSVCGSNAEVMVIGSTDLVKDSVIAPLQAASAGTDCENVFN